MRKLTAVLVLVSFLGLPLAVLAATHFLPIIGTGGILDKVTNVLFTALLSVAAIFIIIAGNMLPQQGIPKNIKKPNTPLFMLS